MNIEKITIQDLIKLVRSNGFIKEANFLEKIHNDVPFGRITVLTHGGRIARVEREVEYDDLSSGL